MTRESLNSNRALSLPRKLDAVGLRENASNPRELVGEDGERYIYLPRSKNPADQMFFVSLLAGEQGQAPVVPIAAIVAKKYGSSWKYFSRITPPIEAKKVLPTETVANSIILLAVLGDWDHALLDGGYNLSVNEMEDGTHRPVFHDLEQASDFWKNYDLFRTEEGKQWVAKAVGDAIREAAIEPGKVRTVKAVVLRKLLRLKTLLDGVRGEEYISFCKQDVPEQPGVYMEQRLQSFSDELSRTRAVRDAMLERIAWTANFIQNTRIPR